MIKRRINIVSNIVSIPPLFPSQARLVRKGFLFSVARMIKEKVKRKRKNIIEIVKKKKIKVKLKNDKGMRESHHYSNPPTTKTEMSESK